MVANLAAGWVSCLDESMLKWVNKYTCPGFVMCLQKPWPLGNEYHSIACCDSGIMYAIKMVEGKNVPPDLPEKQYAHLGVTVGLLLRLTSSIWNTGKVVVLDSAFCVLRGNF